jgi:hypothetical protein
VVVNGRHFAGARARVWFVQTISGTTTTNQLVANPVVGSDGAFRTTVAIPGTALPGQAYINACGNDGLGLCAYTSITVKAA